MPPRTQSLAGTGGVRLHALVWDGGAPPFLLVHGLASNCRTWEPAGEILARHGHAVAAIDLRGHGQSGKPDEGYDFATMAADLGSAMDALGWRRAVVAGQSTGGNLALELAASTPERVCAVIGVDGGLLEPADQWPEWEDCAEALAPPPLAGRPAAEFEGMLRHFHPQWTDAGVAATLANVEICPDGTVRPWLTRERHMRILRALWEQRPSTLVASLAVPLLLLLAGTEDSWVEGKRTAVARAERLGARLRVVWFTSGDHDLHVERPEAVAAAMLDSLADGFITAGS